MGTVVRARSIRVMLVEDNVAVRRAVAGLLNAAGDLEVCGEAATVAEVGAVAEAGAPDVVIVDLRLPDGSGVEAGRQVRAAHPGARVLLLTSASQDEAMAASMLAGASAYLVKQLVGNDLLGTVRAVADGRSLVDSTAAAAALRRLQGGTAPGEEQARLVHLLAEGCTDQQISQLLDVDESTVRSQVAGLTAVLGAGWGRRRRAGPGGSGTRPATEVPGTGPRVPET